MTAVEFAHTVTNLPVEKQNALFEILKGVLSEDDYNATVQFVNWIGLFKSPAKYKAMRTALCEELFGMEVPFSVKTMFES